MLSRTSAAALAGALLSTLASAQAERPSPLQVTSVDEAGGTVTTSPDLAAVAALTDERLVRLTDLYLPGGELVDVELSRLDVDRRRFGFQVDGRPAGDITQDLDLSIWRGHVVGSAGSQVYLSFSNSGCRGWVQTAERLTHLMPRPDAQGSWARSEVVLVDELTLNDLGESLGGFCAYDQINDFTGEAQVPRERDEGAGTYALGACTTRECKLAIETDYQLFQVFGDLGALTSYVTTLLTAASDRYEEQIDTVLTYPYLQFYTNSNDPWSTPESGGDSLAMLSEFESAWAGNFPVQADLGHFLSGAGLGGGVAYLNVLCGSGNRFGVSGNIAGTVSFPVQQQPGNWDFIVFTHEVGHNFGTPHTHDYCPPIDECAPAGYFGQCQTQEVCTSSGTIMSYCHLCSGGTANITTYFHPTVVTTMSNGAQNCLPLYSGISVDPPTTLSTSQATQVVADIAGTLQGSPLLWYRYGGGPFQSVAMQSVGGTLYAGDLPPAACGDSPEFYVFANHQTCGGFTAPAGAPGNVFTASVGVPVPVFSDDMETNTGWTTANLGASSGDWQRGVPVNDPGWSHDPFSDFDGSGAAWLTQNQTGNTDVDNGAVQLTSPAFDLSGGDAFVSYAYYLKLTDQDGTDRLLVEVSTNGTSGPWIPLAVHDTDGGTSWRQHTIGPDDFTAAGVAPTASTAVRFTANDGDAQSIVEAGVDAFVASKIDCGPTGPSSYCAPANGNSVSSAGLVLSHVSGQPGAVLTVQVENAPLQPGVLFFGQNQIDQPFGCGRRCVGGTVVRSSVLMPGASTSQFVLDTTGTATVPFNLQYWYRDPAHFGTCGDSFNLSNALGY